MVTVDFEFDIDERVRTPFGEGIVRIQGRDASNILIYSVLGVNGEHWFKETELENYDSYMSNLGNE